MKLWEEYKSIVKEVRGEGAYQEYAKGQNLKFKKWMTRGKKRPASPYTAAPVLQGKSGLGPLVEDEEYIPQLKSDLNRDVWNEKGKLHPEISEKLLRIAHDFYDKLDLPAPILDITLTGSMANYNWTSKSDIDLHIIIDYSAVSEDVELVKNYLMEAKSNWNRNHEILIKSHEVEIYVQDSNEPHHSTAVYSILDNQWEIRPRHKTFKVSEDAVRQKAHHFIHMIDQIDSLQERGLYEEVYGDAERLREKLRNYRQSGLEEGGEYSVENLVFKYLRNSEEMERIYDLKRRAYDSMMSVPAVKRGY